MADLISIDLKAPSGLPLRFLSMEGSEEISRLFEYGILAVAKPTDTINFDKLLGHPAQVTVTSVAQPPRIYHGLVTAARFEDMLGTEVVYRLTLRPWLWLATRSGQSRIFAKQMPADVLKKVLTPYGGELQIKLQASYRKREYRVQYGESDLQFVSRLMEEEGIAYFFKHEDGKHTMVIGDSLSVNEDMLGLSKLPYLDNRGAGEAVSRWQWGQEIQTTQVEVRDFSFLSPGQNFKQTSTVTRQHAHASLEAYGYPAGLTAGLHEDGDVSAGANEATAIAKRWVDEQQAKFLLVDGQTDARRLCAGARFSLTGHPVAAQNREYIVLSTRVKMRVAGHLAGATQEAEHTQDFRAFPSDLSAFRPARLTPRPRMPGPQTATVVGPAGEEIYVDKYGRVKVQFHWDREGKKNADSSCYIRVAQPSAGKGFGMVFLPRIGQEVVVDFLEGDPDQPLITGRVYNADQMPPYALPANKTVSTVRSRSSGQGAAVADHNELRFEDLKGSEYLLLHAQKDKLEFVKETSKTQIGKDEHHTVKNDRKHKVEGTDHLTVTKAVSRKFDDKFSTTVAKDILVKADGLYSLKTGKDITAQSGAAISMKSSTDLHLKIGSNIGAEAAQNVHLKGGMNVVIEGGMQVTIKAGGSSIVLGPDGVSITGVMVKVNSGGAAGSGAGASPVAPTDPVAPEAPELPTDPLA
ncbi:MAG: type VI secretion system tip protein TssI/VgrG [Rubrivivax sp.]|nr:type VI secretion system tip protein TssI/VgrG [Rubrivivax sp.]